jgi:hypothetical protein
MTYKIKNLKNTICIKKKEYYRLKAIEKESKEAVEYYEEEKQRLKDEAMED